MKLITVGLLTLLLSACVLEEDAFSDQVSFTNDSEVATFTEVDLEQRTGYFSIELTKPKQLEKRCVDTECSQTLFTHNGNYFDFSFIADGDWTKDLSMLSGEETELMLHTQVRRVNGTFYFYQDYENSNPLLFRVEAQWSDFISGDSGNGIEAYYSPVCGCVIIDLDLDDYIAYSANSTEVTSNLSNYFRFEFLL
ncbi:hypothetical protein Q4575_01430 [Psychrosphaera sp. 1_MG-2023]|uniref:Lipoprotein n=1 Tax=Psychrosphaera algicola TaxID=3023714 RepID=A0ABT5F8R3_9GAMM|nr:MULTISPECIES: hypothetical protein [unclassified Psychrosphaera]MDC2887928.1 hypothetical protein [Psychrosphaera sp. G1-22]MDO6718040.1 hypothetical protein [Psychrosphaera sp. 1_MG-2023]